jgi:hypothetical protein
MRLVRGILDRYLAGLEVALKTWAEALDRLLPRGRRQKSR